MALDFSTIGLTLGAAAKNAEARLQTTLTNMAAKEDLSTTDLLQAQVQVQGFTLMVQATSSMTKELGDTFKEVLQKT